MSISEAIICGGWAYACSCLLSPGVSPTGIQRGRIVALFCTALGIGVELLLINI